MSLEIREMIIRSTLTGADTITPEKKQRDNITPPETDTEHIVALCMERVTEWLRTEQER